MRLGLWLIQMETGMQGQLKEMRMEMGMQGQLKEMRMEMGMQSLEVLLASSTWFMRWRRWLTGDEHPLR